MKSLIHKILIPISAAAFMLGAITGVLFLNPTETVTAKAENISPRIYFPPSDMIEQEGPDGETSTVKPTLPQKPSSGNNTSGGGESGGGAGSGTDKPDSPSSNPINPPHVHSYALVSSVIYSRCDIANQYTYTCGCGDTIYKYGEVKEHTWSEDTKTKPEDLRTVPCGEMYYINGKCVVCGYEVNNDVKKEINHEYTYSSLVPGNSFSCTNLYRMNYTCLYCTSSVIMTSDHKGHDYQMVYNKNEIPERYRSMIHDKLKAPTCTKSGVGVKMCARIFEDGSLCKDVDCTQGVPELYIEDALGHNMTTVSITYPTCTQSGKEISSCTRCGLRAEKEYPAYGHKPETKDENGKTVLYCSVCNSQLVGNNNIFLLIIDAYKGIFETYGPYILGVLGTLVGVWGIYLAIRYVTANDTEDKKRVKRMLVNSAIGILLITILISVAVPVIQIISTLV